MARAEAAAGFAVEVFVKQNQVSPMRVGGVFLDLAMAGPRAVFVRQESAGQPAGDLLRGFLQVHHVPGAGGAFDLEAVAIEMVITLERFDDQVIDREPDRSAPIGVAAEEVARPFAWHIIDPMLFVAGVEDVGMIAMVGETERMP